MFVFSRRYLQTCLDGLSPTMSGDQRRALAKRLDTPGNDRLPAMWEVVFLSALSKHGQLRHEVELPGGRRPDIELDLTQNGGASVNLVGDIAAVSDAGLDEQNPIETLSDEISSLARKYGLNPDHFGYEVKGGQTGTWQKAEISLLLPNRGTLIRLIREYVEPFIQRVAQQRTKKESYAHQAAGIAFIVSYDPGQRYATGSYLDYTASISLTNNPIFRKLRSKAKQLGQAPASSLKMIILCDGGCATMHRPPNAGSYRSVTAAQIAKEFLRQNSRIDLVLLVKVMTSHPSFGALRLKRRLEVEAIEGARLERFGEPARHALYEILNASTRNLPEPVLDSINAAIRCQEPGTGPDNIGGGQVADNWVTISSRALHRLLAGEITQERFFAAHRWDTSEPGSMPNPFRRLLRDGRMLVQAEVQSGGDHDDDWITLRFGDPDAAASAFVVRNRSRE